MASTQYYVAQSLDGWIAERDGGLGWLTGYGGEAAEGVSASAAGPMEEGGAYHEFYAGIGALAMGSATYEFVLDYGGWPYEGRPTWVFTSRSLPVPAGADVRFADGDVAEVHAEMLAAVGERNLWVVGGGNLASQFADAGLLDELLVTIVPVVLGDGLPTFARRLEGRQLRLKGTRAFGNGMTELRYELVR